TRGGGTLMVYSTRSWSVKVSSTRSCSAELMNGGGIGIGMECPLRTIPLRVVMAFSSPFGLATVLLGRDPDPEVEVVFIWKKLAIIYLSSLLHINITLADALILMPKYQKMLKVLLSNKEKLQELANTPRNENCSAVILKKLPKNLETLGNFSFRMVSMNSSANGTTIYSSSPSQLLDEFADDLALITFPPEYDDDLQFDIESDLKEIEYLLHQYPIKDIDSSLKDSNDQSNLVDLNDNLVDFMPEMFTDEHALDYSSPLLFDEYDDDLQFDIESDLKEIEYLLHQYPIKDIDSSLKDSNDQSNLVDLNDNLVDFMPEMFTDEHALDYSSPLLFDEYDDDIFKVKSDTENVYDDPFDSKGEKIKESKLLIDELDLPCDFLFPSKYDSILSEDFYRVDALPSTNNEDKVFNPDILIQENLFEIITRVVQDKKLSISHASLMIKDFDPPLYELPFFKEVLRSNMLLPFSSENEEKVFKPKIHTSRKVHSSLIPELSHLGYKVFKINQILRSLMKIFLFSYGKDTHILVVSCLHFYPLDQFKYEGIGSS
nr:reverse transcriptase domain-containing protein [Tanacetum cinerariifolium]